MSLSFILQKCVTPVCSVNSIEIISFHFWFSFNFANGCKIQWHYDLVQTSEIKNVLNTSEGFSREKEDLQLAAFTIRFVTEKCESGFQERMLGVYKTLTKITRSFSHNTKFILYVKHITTYYKTLKNSVVLRKGNSRYCKMLSAEMQFCLSI